MPGKRLFQSMAPAPSVGNRKSNPNTPAAPPHPSCETCLILPPTAGWHTGCRWRYSSKCDGSNVMPRPRMADPPVHCLDSIEIVDQCPRQSSRPDRRRSLSRAAAIRSNAPTRLSQAGPWLVCGGIHQSSGAAATGFGRPSRNGIDDVYAGARGCPGPSPPRRRYAGHRHWSGCPGSRHR